MASIVKNPLTVPFVGSDGYDGQVSADQRGRRRRATRLAAVAVVGVFGGLVALALAPPVRRTVGPGQVSLSALPAWHGASALALPPFGEVTAATHSAPLRLELRVDQVDIESLERTFETDDPEAALRADAQRALSPLLRTLVLRSLVAALAGGLVAVALLPRRAPHRLLVGGASATGAVALLLAWSWVSYDATAFDDATFVGPVERAPALLEAAQRHVAGLSDVRDRVEVLSRQVSALYAAVEKDPVEATTTILHVSDIHSNPLGIEIVEQLAAAFDVDAVLDTGDLTSFGNTVEARITDLIDDLDVRYLFVPGNHDSPATRMLIAATPGVTLLDGQVVTVRGIRILGMADPTFTATNEIDTKAANARRVAAAGSAAASVRRLQPDLLAVHDERQAGTSYGLVPVIVSGHLHHRRDRTRMGTRALVVGSTGATGLGAFTVDADLAYEAELLRFDGDRLVAIDYVTLDGVSGEFAVQRRIVDQRFTRAPLDGPGVR